MTTIDPATAVDTPPADPSDAIVAAMRAWDIERIMADPPAALAAGVAARDQAARLDAPCATAHALLVCGGAHALLGAFDAADDALTAARAHFRTLRDPWGEVATTLRHNLVWAHRDWYRRGVEELDAVLPLARDLGDPALLFGVLNDLARAQAALRALDLAIVHALEAHDLASTLDNAFLVLVSKINLAGLYLEHLDAEATIALCEESLAIIEAHPEFERLAMICEHNLGTCWLDLERAAEAAAWFDRAIASATRHASAYDLATSLYGAGLAYHHLGAREIALARFTQSLDVLQRHKSDDVARMTLARWYIESLQEAWTWDTVRDLQGVLAHPDDISPLIVREIGHALAESCARLGDLAAANEVLRHALDTQERYWRTVTSRQSHLAMQTLQTREARQAAQHERQQREAIAQAMQEIVDLNAQNEELVNRLTVQSAALDRLAREDGLTGVANRRAFDERLHAELVRARLFAHPLAVILTDIDDFKQINDTYSHQTGDRVLLAIAGLLRHACRETDLVARYGGEEFGLVLLEADQPALQAIVERVGQAVRAYDWEAIAPGLRVTVSSGALALHAAELDDTLTPDAVLARVDERLYRAKRGGKDRAVVAQEEMHEDPSGSGHAPRAAEAEPAGSDAS